LSPPDKPFPAQFQPGSLICKQYSCIGTEDHEAVVDLVEYAHEQVGLQSTGLPVNGGPSWEIPETGGRSCGIAAIAMAIQMSVVHAVPPCV
jgi:hypothetical protein